MSQVEMGEVPRLNSLNGAGSVAANRLSTFCQELLSQDVCMPRVLGQLTKYLDVQRPHRALTTPVDDFVQRQALPSSVVTPHTWPGALPGLTRWCRTCSERNDRSGVLAIPICRYDRPVTA